MDARKENKLLQLESHRLIAQLVLKMHALRLEIEASRNHVQGLKILRLHRRKSAPNEPLK